MPKAFWIVRVNVRKPEQYPDYLAAARPAFEKLLEGNARERNVVVEFADFATAMACYRSPEYQKAKLIRNAVAEADFIIVEGA